VFLLRTFFFTAVSIALCAAERVAAVGFALKALTASFKARFVATLRSRRTTVCFARLIADLIIGTGVPLLRFCYVNQRVIIEEKGKKVKRGGTLRTLRAHRLVSNTSFQNIQHPYKPCMVSKT